MVPGRVWVYAGDGSLTQFPDGGASTAPNAKPVTPSIPLQAHAELLKRNGVNSIVESLKLMPVALPYALPIPEGPALRGGDGSLFPGANVMPPNINPTPALHSGIVNAFSIDSNDLQKAKMAGFQQLDTSAYVPEQSCAGADAIVAFGQSNSANSGGSGDLTVTRPDNSGILMFFNGHCYPARDPLLGASVWMGGASVWLQFGRTYVAKNPGKKLIIVPFGIGSSGSWEWAQGGQFHQRLKSVLAQVKLANLNVKYVFWHQGETDGINATTEPVEGQNYNYYIKNVTSIKTTLNESLPGVPMAIAIGTHITASPYFISRQIQKAQFDLVINNYPSIRLGAVGDFLGFPSRANINLIYAPGVLSDDVHYNYPGLVIMGQRWYEATYGNSDYQTFMLRAMIETYLSRAPQSGELAFLAKQGSLQLARNAILASDEFFVRDRLYREIAHRLPEADGYFYWVSQLKIYPRDVVLAKFTNAVASTKVSPDPSKFELKFMSSGWWGSGFSYLHPIHDPGPFKFSQVSGFWELVGQPTKLPEPLGTPPAIVEITPTPSPTVTLTENKVLTALYTGLLARSPDKDGYSFWMGKIQAGSITCANLAGYFLKSDEFITAQKALSHRDFVMRLYQGLLQRTPETEGLNYWAGVLSSGQQTRLQVAQYFLVAPDVPSMQVLGLDSLCKQSGFSGAGPIPAITGF